MRSINDEKDPLELELKAMLDVDPSAGLQSRIRARALAAPEKRISWFTLAAGLATVAIAVIFAALYVQHQPPTVRPPQTVVASTVAPPTPKPTVIAVKKPAGIAAKKPLVIATAFTIVPLKSARIEIASLSELELADAMPPIPQLSIPPVARIEPITLEPLALTVRALGVNE